MSHGTKIKEIEEFPRRIKVFFFVILFVFIFGTLSFKFLTDVSFNEAFIRTLNTLAFEFHEDSPIIERLLEVFLTVVGLFMLWWVLWSVADMILDGNLRKYLKSRLYSFRISKMKNHSIIVGGGRVGEEIARVMTLKKHPFLIIESDPKVVAILKKKNYTIIEGDASNEEILKSAEIEKASKIILSIPNTETNVLLTLTAKELNPKIEVHSRCEKPALVSKLKKAGAKLVVVPEIVAADKIAEDLGF